MADTMWGQGEISLVALLDVLSKNRWRIARWSAAGALSFGAIAFFRPARYPASFSFVPQSGEMSRSGLAGLAGQLGVTIDASNQGLSPEFYRRLLQSRVLLEPIVRDTLLIEEDGRKRIPFLDLFEVPAGPARRRIERGVTLLQNVTAVGVEKSTGVVQVTVTTHWPSVSLAITSALLNGVSNYNEHVRQTQAAAERKFIEGRLSLASSDLRSAEDRLAEFLRTNRQFGGYSQLTFERERLQRDVSLKQNVFTSLTQAYEDARVREVRDTPVITVFEPPAVSALPAPRHRIQSTLLGLILGFIIGSLLAFASVLLNREREAETESGETGAAVPRPKEPFVAQRKWLGRSLS